jgi:hypothetical protein
MGEYFRVTIGMSQEDPWNQPMPLLSHTKRSFCLRCGNYRVLYVARHASLDSQLRVCEVAKCVCDVA